MSMTWVINWEMALYGLIFLVAMATRFYNLGARVMSHDESMHAYFSFQLYNGGGYAHDPRLHGPLQFHLVALAYLLFGANDFTARIPAALFGVALLMLPYWFRPWLGKTGALVTSLGLLISPSLLYYQRYIRNDALILFFTALMTLSLFQYMRTRQRRWLYGGGAAVSLALSTKEVALIHGFIGLVFIGAAFLWERLSARRFKWVALSLAGVIGLLLGGAWLLAGVSIQAGETVTFFNQPKRVKDILLLIGLLAGVLTVARNADRHDKPVSRTLLSFQDPNIFVGPITMAVVIFVLLHTTFLTNPRGLISGTYGAVTYWLKQQSIERGSQPGYYYLMLMALYEFLPLLVGGVGGLIYLVKKAPAHTPPPDTRTGKRATSGLPSPPEGGATIPPSDGGTFAAYLIFWAIGGLVIYSWAGEKMPWLNVHIALPFIFLVGHVSQTALDKFRRSEPRLSGQAIKPGLYLVLLSVLTVLTIRFAWLASFINYDYVNEYLAYAHGAPDIKWVLAEIDRISRHTAGEKQIKIAYGGIPWPLEWYLREYPNRVFFGDEPTQEALDAPIIIFAPNSNLSDVTVEDIEPLLGDNYHRFDYRLVWWPLEDYKDQTLKRLWHAYLVSDPALGDSGAETIRRNWRSLWQIIFYRNNVGYSFDKWPHRTRLYIFVDKDMGVGWGIRDRQMFPTAPSEEAQPRLSQRTGNYGRNMVKYSQGSVS